MTWTSTTWDEHKERLIAHYAKYAVQEGLKAYIWKQINDIAQGNPTLRDELPQQFLSRVGMAKEGKRDQETPVHSNG